MHDKRVCAVGFHFWCTVTKWHSSECLCKRTPEMTPRTLDLKVGVVQYSRIGLSKTFACLNCASYGKNTLLPTVQINQLPSFAKDSQFDAIVGS